jgi:predicted aspartyl protease
MEYEYSERFTPLAPVVEISISAPFSESSVSSLALVDSGADITIISHHIISRLKLRRVDSTLVSGFDRKAVETTVYSAALSIENVIKPQIYRVLSWEEDYTLIGKDLLNKLIVVLNGQKGKLNLSSTYDV